MSDLDVARNLLEVQGRMAAALIRAGRSPSETQLIAVSKLVPVERLATALRAGQLLFGENYVQEGKLKQAQLVEIEPSRSAEFHLIGPLQSNKIKDAVGAFELIHSVHRLDIAEKISHQALKIGISQKILIQVNTSGESSKSGFPLDELQRAATTVARLPGIELEGLMTIGEYLADSASRAERVREFVRLRQARDSLSATIGPTFRQLSMGMSHDFELAIEEGATLVRVGSAIFGERERRGTND